MKHLIGHPLYVFSMSLISCFYFVRDSVGISQGYLCTQGQWEGNNLVFGKRTTDSQTQTSSICIDADVAHISTEG